jgi:dipeptidyl aminopeptidase/acylaminoacyl peptidase
MKKITFLLPLFSTLLAPAQVRNLSSLSVDQIMQGEDFVGYLPAQIGWSEDSKVIYFSWNPEMDTIRSSYQVDIQSKNIRRLTDQELKNKDEEGAYDTNYTRKVYEKDGDLFLMELADFRTRRITHTTQRESAPRFSGDETSIIYRAGNNLFRWDLEDGSTTQLTDFKPGSGDEKNPDPQDQWLEKDQMEQFEVLVQRENEEQARNNRNERVETDRPMTVYLGNKQMRGLTVSPDLRYVIYQLVHRAADKHTMVPDFVTRSGYTKELNSRPKVGAPRDQYESWILDLEADTAYGIDPAQIEGIYDKPSYAREYEPDPEQYVDTVDQPREVVIGSPIFSNEGNAAVEIMAMDYKDRWIMWLDPSDGSLKSISRQHDDAWIGGPGIGWLRRGNMGWIDGETLWFQSEQSGYSHLYAANVITGKVKALTEGAFEILNVTLSRDKQTFYITSNKQSPHEHHFYHLPASGGRMTQVTYMKGGHEVTVSPDEQWLAIRYSFSNQPWELFMMANEKGGEMIRLTASTTDAFRTYPWKEPEIIRFMARDGAEVPATLYQPEDDVKNGAAVIFVHGAGYLQNVHYWWPQYYREHMFHQLLADNGYTVLAIDFRASAGYGRDWRTAIYRHMGGKDLEDQVDGARYLTEQHGISTGRIGIYGGSYGGFITLMAMFQYPETFTSGAALRSVTDWAHYNHGYTAAILNTPVEDSLSYIRSSPIYYADGLQGNLLMLHGMIDTNVHFQDIVRLSQRLIELKKENWELAVFPLEGHGFQEASSWSDEYRRIFKLFQETLNQP